MADRYWVGGSGNTNDATNHWATSSGGAPGAGNTPTSADNIHFDSLSNSTAYTVTVNANLSCLDILWDALPLVSGVPTLTGSNTFLVAGNVVMIAGMVNTHTGNLSFSKAGTATITTAGVVMPNGINSSATTLQLADDYTANNASGVNLTCSGTFDPNGKTFTLQAENTNGNFSLSPLFNFTVTGGASTGKSLYLTGNITVTNNLVINGNNASTNRLLVMSSVLGTQRTITCNGTITATNIDVRDIIGAGSASWDLSAITGGSGDCAGNSGITFTTGAPMYWFKDTGSFSTTANWFLGSGGTGGAGRVPLAQDTARFDSASFSAGSKTVTQDVQRTGAIDWTGATNTPTFTTSTNCEFYGSITLISGMTLTASAQGYKYYGSAAVTITSAGKSWAKAIENDRACTFNLGDAFVSSSTLIVAAGVTFNTNNFDVTVSGFRSTGSADTLNLGSSTVTVTGTGSSAFSISATTVNTNTATIKFTNTSATATTFAGNGKTYGGGLYLNMGTSTKTLTITGANTFGDIKDDGTAAHTIIFPNATTTTTTWNANGNSGALLTLSRTGASGTWTIAKAGGGTVSANYLSISNSAASPAITWYANTTSTDGGGNTGWVFTAPPSGYNSRAFLGFF